MSVSSSTSSGPERCVSVSWKLPLLCVDLMLTMLRDRGLQPRRHVAAMVLGRRRARSRRGTDRCAVWISPDERFHLRSDERQEPLAADGDDPRHERKPASVRPTPARTCGSTGSTNSAAPSSRGSRRRPPAIVGRFDEQLADRLRSLEQRDVRRVAQHALESRERRRQLVPARELRSSTPSALGAVGSPS